MSMRYIGNKKALLSQILECSRKLGFRRGMVCDLFAGTGLVGRAFRARGSTVFSTDTMASSYVFQRVFLELDGPPRFASLESTVDLPPPAPAERLRADTAFSAGELGPALRVVRFLEEVIEPCAGLLTRQYSPEGSAGRMYLRPEHARRLDAILLALREWLDQGVVTEEEGMLLLAATIDATDRIANISGTYAAYLKRWQPNTRGPVELRLPPLVKGPSGRAARRDAWAWLPEVDADILYIDPPYNNRQYPANYHLLEVVARIPEEPDLAAFERTIYGKTGLFPWRERASRLCSRRARRARDAFRELLLSTRIPRVVISYNEEGIIQRDEFFELLAEYADVPRRELEGNGALTTIPYRRFRSDADGRVSSTGSGRSYRVVPGRRADEVHEWIFAVGRVT